MFYRQFFKIIIVTVFFIVSTYTVAETAERPGQLDSEIEWFESGEKRYGLNIKYAGQKTSVSKLILTAGNCFWNEGIRAYKAIPVSSKTGKTFIGYEYEYLENWKSTNQQINWHIWCEQPGEIRASVNLEVAMSQAGSQVEISLGEQMVSFKTIANTELQSYTQPQNIIFNITKRGKYTITIRATAVKANEVGKLRTIELSGSAITNASVLRARWRPAAVHGRLWSSKVKDSKIWVVQSRTAKGYSSYSPITTPFGYYGASFDAEGRTSTSMNFSMWSYARGKEEPPIEQLSHLIAVGSPDATFGGFGHEGTGVKLRGKWQPLAAKPTILTQALRLEPGELYDTYYGYYLDPGTNKWKFFAAGKKWHQPGRGAKNLSSPGSFVEVPGPPDRQRSGDLRREGFIRGWVPDSTGKWHLMDMASKGRDKNANKFWAFHEGGWYSKSMGGMEHFDQDQSKELKLSDVNANVDLPVFLSKANVQDLYKIPAEFKVEILETTSSEAKILIDAKDPGTNATIKIYYGSKEGLTFTERWEKNIDLGQLSKRQTLVTIPELKSGTPYFCRILIENDQGKIWSAETCKFQTK
ncbi:MAG: DUF3472 domain-containing protein [Phycisphaerae bacterium]|nr:DUF3472 domain-containing protein [Phycisphaerae bacterium]